MAMKTFQEQGIEEWLMGAFDVFNFWCNIWSTLFETDTDDQETRERRQNKELKSKTKTNLKMCIQVILTEVMFEAIALMTQLLLWQQKQYYGEQLRLR